MFFIHIKDPQFHEAPWPGMRRLGPYESRKDAETQATHDKAAGAAVEGVYSEKDSEKQRGDE